MGASAETTQLVEALEAQERLKMRGFTASCGEVHSVVVDRWGHMRGVWQIHNGRYFWTSGASSQPAHSVATIEEAVTYTLTVIAAA